VGQGTAGMEFLESHPAREFIFAPVGGGGLVAGTALAAHFFSKNCRVIGGLKTQLGENNFPIFQQHVERIIRVSENEILDAMKLIWERMKIVVEPSSAVALAALFKEKESFKNKNIGVILSGGDVDLTHLAF